MEKLKIDTKCGDQTVRWCVNREVDVQWQVDLALLQMRPRVNT